MLIVRGSQLYVKVPPSLTCSPHQPVPCMYLLPLSHPATTTTAACLYRDLVQVKSIQSI